jgi:hypothetical protein
MRRGAERRCETGPAAAPRGAACRAWSLAIGIAAPIVTAMAQPLVADVATCRVRPSQLANLGCSVSGVIAELVVDRGHPLSDAPRRSAARRLQARRAAATWPAERASDAWWMRRGRPAVRNVIDSAPSIRHLRWASAA